MKSNNQWFNDSEMDEKENRTNHRRFHRIRKWNGIAAISTIDDNIHHRGAGTCAHKHAHLFSIITKNVNNNKLVNMIESSDQKQREKSTTTMIHPESNNGWREWRNLFSSGFWLKNTNCFSNYALLNTQHIILALHSEYYFNHSSYFDWFIHWMEMWMNLNICHRIMNVDNKLTNGQTNKTEMKRKYRNCIVWLRIVYLLYV